MDRELSLKNRTIVLEFFLLGFSNYPQMRHILFVIFLFMYLMTLIGNLLILILVHSDHYLHTPMYFFLGHLACVDAFTSSVTVPRLIIDLLSKKKIISQTSCVSQMFFFMMFTCVELYLLAVMSYDRYVAICKPLHYLQIMSWHICTMMASAVWALGFIVGLTHAVFTTRLIFCQRNTIRSFFCELTLLLQLSCTDIFINILVIFLITFIVGFFTINLTFIPYVHIFFKILRIQTKEGKHKAFSTCTSHLTVVFIFYGTLFFTYLRPKPNHHGIGDTLVSLIYTTITPIVNPIIYSLRNKELIAAYRKHATNV